MSPEDISVIVAFAKGDNSLRELAVDVFRKNMATHGPRGNKYQRFMAEANNPAPDLALRARYRAEVLSDD
nr:hypothetical protein [Neorhizobium tomejilense]